MRCEDDYISEMERIRKEIAVINLKTLMLAFVWRELIKSPKTPVLISGV
jgi:hypothetical protein